MLCSTFMLCNLINPLKTQVNESGKLLLAPAGAVCLGSESHGAHDHTLLFAGSGDLQTLIIKDWVTESDLLYDWRLTANQFFLVPIPVRLTIRDIFKPNPCGYSPYLTSSLTRGNVCLLWIGFAFVKCTCSYRRGPRRKHLCYVAL
jgi:hypothetical protein